jgi:hypothetical protein
MEVLVARGDGNSGGGERLEIEVMVVTGSWRSSRLAALFLLSPFGGYRNVLFAPFTRREGLTLREFGLEG